MKKKLLFVIDSLHSGGAEKSLVSLLSTLDYKKIYVDLLLFNRDGLYLPLVPKDVNILNVPEYFSYDKSNKKKRNFKIEFCRIKNSILLRNPIYKKKYHTAQITAKNILGALKNQSVKYDIAIAYSQGLPTYYVAEKINATKKICWVNTDYKRAKYNKRFDKDYYKEFDNIVAVSEKNKEVLEGIYPEFKDKMRIIYDIISPKLVKEMANEGEGYKDGFEGIKILTIGRHVHLKGYDMAIDAAKILKDKNIKFRWYSIGEGILTEELKKQVKSSSLEDYFVFLGTYINPYPFIKECDIYCQPSRFEGFGMAIAEAKILAKPIIATNFDIIHNQIKNGKNGLIVDMKSQEVFKGIHDLMVNKEMYTSIISTLKKELVNSENEIDKFYKILES